MLKNKINLVYISIEKRFLIMKYSKYFNNITNDEIMLSPYLFYLENTNKDGVYLPPSKLTESVRIEYVSPNNVNIKFIENTDTVGEIDENNTIKLSQDLPSGEYSLYYEGENDTKLDNWGLVCNLTK